MDIHLLILCVCVVVCTGYEFSGNLSSKAIKDNRWSYKYTVATPVDIPLFYIGGNFVAGQSSRGLLTGDIDIVAGSAYVVTSGFPFAYLAYFKDKYNVSYNAGQGSATANMTASAGYMGTAMLSIEERNHNNTLVAVRSLKWMLNLNTNQGMTYTLSEASQLADDIQYVTFTGNTNDENYPRYSVDITYMATRCAGIVKGEGIQDVAVVPGTIESIIKINNYPYQDRNNSISLVMAVGTGSAQVSGSGQTLYDASKQVYFSVSKSAYVSNNKVSVNISVFADGSFGDIDNSNFQQQVYQKYGAASAVKFIKVSFPPGAANIVYDPSIGNGVSVEDSNASHGGGSGASSHLSPILSLVLFVSTFFFLI